MRFRKSAALWAATALLSGSAASAQDAPQQTVEGAQRFLALVAANGQMIAQGHYVAWPALGLQYKITGATPGECFTEFTASPQGYNERGASGTWIIGGNTQWSDRRFEAVRTRAGVAAPPFKVDWSRVINLSLSADTTTGEGDGDNVLISWSGGYILISLPDQAMAKRVEYAAFFLKAACDRTAETGF